MPENEKAMTSAATGFNDTKKKRSRKKRSKKGKASTDEARSTSSDSPMVAASASTEQRQLSAESKMNPHAFLRHRIQEEGFTTVQIDQAMEEMWNKDLAYDEYEAVLNYLKGEKDEKKNTNSPSDDESRNFASREGGSKVEPATSADKGMGIHGLQAAASRTPETKPATPMTMEQKLEMVAEFENMTDAVFALTEWVGKAAKPKELEDLCAATKTPALITIFRRSITECKEQSNFDKAVMPSMARLMSSLLRKSGIPSAGVEETRTAFETLLRQARRIFFMQQGDAEDFSNRVSKFIVSRLSLAMGESKSTKAERDCPNDNSSVSTSAQAAALADNSVFADLLSSREINMTAAKRYGAMSRSALAVFATQNGNSSRTNSLSRETEIGHSDVMLALVGEDAKAAMEVQKVNLEELKAKAEEGETESIQELRISIEELSSERETIKQRILELKQSIDKLETYDAELCVKVDEAQVQLDSEIALASAESNDLNGKIKEASDAIKYGGLLSGLATSLKRYNDSLERAIKKITVIPSVDPAYQASKQMDVFVSRARTYFQVEADTIQYLQNRRTKCQMEVDELETEVDEMQGLGLETTIGQLKISAKEKRDLVQKDSIMIQHFVDEANSMFDSLVSRLEDYKSLQKSHALELIQKDILYEIVSYASRIGITSTQQLESSMKYMNGHSEVHSKSSNFAVDDSNESVIPTFVASSVKTAADATPIEDPTTSETTSSSVATAPAVPKLTWAAAKSNGESPSKTSLLDIQREELLSKET